MAYLDILGYKNIIDNETPEKFYQSMRALFEDIKVGSDSLYPKDIRSDSDFKKQYLQGVKSAIDC